MTAFSARVSVCACLAMLVALPATAFREPTEVSYPPDFDRRDSIESDAGEGRRTEIEGRVRDAFGSDLAIHWEEGLGHPSLILRPQGRLGVAPLGGDPVDAAREFLKAGRTAFELSDAEIDALDAAKVYRSKSLRTTHVQFLQRVEGISVFRGQVRLNIADDGGVLNVGGSWFPGLAAPGRISLSAEDALFAAARDLGLSGTIPSLVLAEPTGERRTVWAGGGEYLEPPQARLVLLPLPDGSVAGTWEVTIHEAATGLDHLYMTLVDATTGELWFRELLTKYMNPENAVGLAFECEDPEDCTQSQVSLAGDPTASPNFWVDGDLTIGNNIAARVDWNGRDQNDPAFAADGGAKLEFLFPFNDSMATNGSHIADRDSAIVNGFYWGNLIHDHWWHLGFDEAAGNYQTDNFGNGGLGGDHVNVDLQDSANIPAIRNNATWSPSLDGSQPRTNYFLWTSPDRDGSFDAGVIWHEFGHGLSTRLVGGPSQQCLSGVQGGGMGEGWGDWFAVHWFSGPADDPNGPVVVGGYVTGDQVNGIRRYPYSTDPAVNPLTYADLCNQGCQVHRDGEIWANALWGVRRDLIEQHGYTEGFSRAEQIVMDGLKLSPCSPNFVSMRDLIMQASEQNYGTEDLCLLREAFARRGLGASASSNGTGSDIVADFALVAPLDDSIGFDSKTAISWDARSDAEAYEVARGTFVAASGNAFDDADCMGETPTESWTAGATPAPGTGFFYTVAVRDDCAVSSHGENSEDDDRTVTGCP